MATHVRITVPKSSMEVTWVCLFFCVYAVLPLSEGKKKPLLSPEMLLVPKFYILSSNTPKVVAVSHHHRYSCIERNRRPRSCHESEFDPSPDHSRSLSHLRSGTCQPAGLFFQDVLV